MKKFFLTLSLLILSTNFGLTITGCSSKKETGSEKETGLNIKDLQTQLEKGIDTSGKLSVRNTQLEAVEFINSYVKKKQPLIQVNIKDAAKNEEKLTSHESLVAIQLTLGVNNIDVTVKLLGIKTEVKMQVEELFSYWNGKIEAPDLTSDNTYTDAFAVIKADPNITDAKYSFKIELLSGTEQDILKAGDNSIQLVFAIENETENKAVTLVKVKKSNMDLAWDQIKTLDVNKEITNKHKTEKVLKYLNDKLVELINNKVIVKEIVTIDLVAGNKLKIKLEDENKKQKNVDITLSNVDTFTLEMGYKELSSLVKGVVIPLKLNDTVEVFKKAIADLDAVKTGYSFNETWEISIPSSEYFDTETVTDPDDKRPLKLRWKLASGGAKVSVETVEVFYTVE